MYFPTLERTDNYINEYRKHNKTTIMAIVHSYLYYGLSHRSIEKIYMNFYGPGYKSMQVLHFLGIVGKHKGIFNKTTIKEIINILENVENSNDIISLYKNHFIDNTLIKDLEIITNNFINDMDRKQFEALTQESTSIQELEAYYNSDQKVRNQAIQTRFRKALLKEFNHKCAMCDITVPSLLVASHIVPYSKCNNHKNWLGNPNNGLLLCINHDALFESGNFITFVNGNIEISHNIPNELYDDFNISTNIRLDETYRNHERMTFLSKHNIMFHTKN